MRGYFAESQKPWPSLLVVLPLVAVYEAASRGMLRWLESGPADQLVAFSLLRRAFLSIGAQGAMLPALALVASLLGWHIAKRDRWSVKPMHLGAMAVEGCLLALPLVALALLVSRAVPFAATTTAVPRLAVLSIGAAVYEELIFRLVGFVLLSVILSDICRFKPVAANTLTLISTAGLFAAYHYLGAERFSLGTCGFRFVAGIFLGLLFTTRGFGVTAFCHAAYDVLCVTLLAPMSDL